MVLVQVETATQTNSTSFKSNYRINNKSEVKDHLNPSELTLPDKVYTFFAPSTTLFFDDLYLEEEHMYYILVELVTAHNCTTRIRVWDPDSKQFNIFESEMFFNPDYGRSFEIPFGAAISGHHDVEIFVECEYNLNMYVRIMQGPKCLHDKIAQQYVDSLIYYQVNRFYNERQIDFDIKLKTDVSYKFFVGRVSAISIEDDNEVDMTCIAKDSNGAPFTLKINEPLADVNGMTTFPFGTAAEGVYTITIKIYCAALWVNIAYAVSEDYQISEIVEANDTKPDEPGKSEEDEYLESLWGNATELPLEYTVGTIIFTGGLTATVGMILVRHKQKNAVNLVGQSKRKLKQKSKK